MRSLRPRAPSAAHQEAVARRLAQLDAELTAVRTTAARRAGGPDGSAAAGVGDHDPGRWDEGGWDVAPALAAGVPWDLPPAPVVAPDSHTRPRAVPLLGDPGEHGEHGGGEADEVVLGVVPHPGRHASRRPPVPGRAAPSAPAWASLVPETLRGRAGLGPAQLAVVAVLVSLGLGVTCWWVLRSDPEPLPATAPVGALVTPSGAASPVPSVPPSAPVAPGASSVGPGAAASGAAAGAEVVVDVAGKVRRPGIAVLPGGSRVADALEAAGGARPGVDLTSLNLARVLLDGEQVLVGVAAAPGAPVGGSSAPPGSPLPPGATGAPDALVNLNTADLALLDTLPGVGPVTAQAILDWRTENGGFTAVDDLLDVSGIGEVTLAELTPLVTV